MEHRDQASGETPPPSADIRTDDVTGEPGAPVVADAASFDLELEAGPVLAEIISQGVSADANADALHAALVSQPYDAAAELDVAAEHLIQAVDLFDVPMGDSGDVA